MSLDCEPYRTLNRKELGRTYWGFIHTEANIVQNKNDVLNFIQEVKNILSHYPCHICQEHAQTNCSEHIRLLDSLLKRAEMNGWRAATVAWAAKFHACVTQHLPSDATSDETRRIAKQVMSLHEDDDAGVSALFAAPC